MSAPWLDDAVFYQIYPQSFRDTDGDGIGDFQGIVEKLDYVHDLGFNAIWINPCFESPFGDAGYDVSDYLRCASRYGTNDDLRRLMAEVHARGMHVLLDLVPGHTSIDHPWFKASMRADANEFTDRYIWTDSVWKSPAGMASLTGISQRDGSCAVNFFSHQPALNYGFYQVSESWQQPTDAPGPQATISAIEDVMRFWLTAGCDGFRVDMAGSLVKADSDSLGTIAVWQQVRAFLNEEFPQAAMVSEWGEPAKSLEAGFDMDFVLQFGPSHYLDLFRVDEPFFSSRGRGDASAFIKTYLESWRSVDGRGLICVPSGNHDMDRLARRLQGDELKIAFAFLLTMPGAPFVYYGDEIGMRYVGGIFSVEGGYDRCCSRTPMQWNGEKNAGFSTADVGDLYLPIDPEGDRPTVEGQLVDSDSLLNTVRALTEVRHAHPALQSRGDIEFLSEGYPLVYVRTEVGVGRAERLLVAINPADTERSFPCDLVPGACVYALNGTMRRDGSSIVVPAQSASVCLL